MKEFNKFMLKDGDKLTLRNGTIGFVNTERDYMFILDDDNICWFDDLTRNTSHFDGDYPPNNGEDIVKVERIQVDKDILEDCINGNVEVHIDYEKLLNEHLTYQTIWEREELKTLDEVAKEMFGWSEQEFMKEFNVFRDKINEIVEVINNGR